MDEQPPGKISQVGKMHLVLCESYVKKAPEHGLDLVKV